MTTLKEYATDYTPPQKTRNIVELDSVHVSIDLQTETATDKEGKAFSYNYIEKEGQKYRVPVTVVKQLRLHLEANPNLLTFKVNKKGEGMETEYIVIPLSSNEEVI